MGVENETRTALFIIDLYETAVSIGESDYFIRGAINC